MKKSSPRLLALGAALAVAACGDGSKDAAAAGGTPAAGEERASAGQARTEPSVARHPDSVPQAGPVSGKANQPAPGSIVFSPQGAGELPDSMRQRLEGKVAADPGESLRRWEAAYAEAEGTVDKLRALTALHAMGGRETARTVERLALSEPDQEIVGELLFVYSGLDLPAGQQRAFLQGFTGEDKPNEVRAAAREALALLRE